MTARGDHLSTLVEMVDSPFDGCEEPASLVRRRSTLSGGSTMWQARLVLSTLEPDSEGAAILRNAIRGGDFTLSDALLESIYEKTEVAPMSEAKGAGHKTATLTTVLPPSPQLRKLEVG